MALEIKKSVIEIGLEKPIKFLQITDPHMDIVKSENKWENTEYFEEAMKYARENDLFVICTGDVFDGVSEDNVAYIREKVSENDIFLVGNHDFCRRPDNAGLDNPSSLIKYSKDWIPVYGNIFFESKIINGVNFVLMQNVFYHITYGQIQMLQAEVAKGYPVVLLMHIPLFAKEKADEMMSTWAPCAYMILPPDEYLARYGERHRIQQTPTEETLDAVEYIAGEPAIKAIIAGHIHEDFDGFADCGKRQITTAPLKDGFARIIEII